MENYANDYEVRMAQLEALQGATSGVHDIYTADLAILEKLKEGVGAKIDDSTTALDKVWSSSKTNTEIQNAIALGFKVQVVQELPATGSPKILYLVPKQSAGQGDVYDEYIWTENGYEKIGSTAVDLSNYYTKAQTEEKIAQGVTGRYQIKYGVNINNNEVEAQAYGQYTRLQGHQINLVEYDNDFTIKSSGNIIYKAGGTTDQAHIKDIIKGVTGKQDVLVSGTNIKTVNGNTLLGSGDITISGGAVIDDTATGSTSVVWSAGKVYNELTEDEAVTAQALHLLRNGKQNTLVSGTNIKTVQGNTLLGSGNVDLSTLFANKSYVTGHVGSLRDGVDGALEIIAQGMYELNQKIEQGSSASLNLVNQILA